MADIAINPEYQDFLGKYADLRLRMVQASALVDKAFHAQGYLAGDDWHRLRRSLVVPPLRDYVRPPNRLDQATIARRARRRVLRGPPRPPAENRTPGRYGPLYRA